MKIMKNPLLSTWVLFSWPEANTKMTLMFNVFWSLSEMEFTTVLAQEALPGPGSSDSFPGFKVTQR